MKTARCGSCGAAIIFIPVHKQAGGLTLMPLDAAPDPGGNIIVGPSGMASVGRIRAPGEDPARHEALHLPHFATCPQAAAWRRRDQPAAPKPAPPPQPGLF